MGWIVLAACVLVSCLFPRDAVADELREPGVRPTPAWLLAQAVPSPSVGLGERGAHLGLLWQVTPVSFAWSIHHGLSPWRFLVVEPNLRQGGSIEVYVSPGIFWGSSTLGLLEPGIRAYFPFVEHGEYLSGSIATSYRSVDGHDSASFEGGVYVLYGIVGLQVSVAPGPRQPLASVATLRLRYF